MNNRLCLRPFESGLRQRPLYALCAEGAAAGRNFLAGLFVALFVFFLGDGASAAPQPVLAVASVAELKAADGAKTPILQVTGYYSGSLLGGGLFVWQAGCRLPDNCTIFAPGNGKGAWVRHQRIT